LGWALPWVWFGPELVRSPTPPYSTTPWAPAAAHLKRTAVCTAKQAAAVMSVAKELLPVAMEWEQAAAKVSAPPLTREEQEVDILLSDAQAPEESLVAGQRNWWPLRAAGGALLLACLLAAAAGAVVTLGSPAARRSTNPARLRRLDRGDGFVDSRNPSLRRAAMQDDSGLTAAFSVHGLSLFDDQADGTDEAQLDEQRRAPPQREGQGGKETRDERSFERAFQEPGSMEEVENGGQTVLEKLIRDLPGGRRLLSTFS